MTEVEAGSILRLHDELFYLVFRHLSDIYPPGKGSRLGWITCTHVCTRWRRIGIDECATLWGECLCAFPRAFTIFLARARDAKLSIDLVENIYRSTDRGDSTWLESEYVKDALSATFQYRAQLLERVSMAFPAFRPERPPFRSTSLQDEVPVGMPQLVELDTNILAENARISARGERASLLSSAALSGLMGKTLPGLQKLELVYDKWQCTVESTEIHHSTAFVASNLISLKLHRQRIPVHILCDILQHTPLLETLDVQWTFSDGVNMTNDVTRLKEPLVLPLLQDVSIGSPTLSLEGLCFLVNLIRPHADVRLQISGVMTSLQGASEFLEVLAPQMRRPSLDMVTIRWGFPFAHTGARIAFSSTLSTPSDVKPCVDIVFERQRSPIEILKEQFVTPAEFARFLALRLDVDFVSVVMEPGVMDFLVHFTAVEELHLNLSADGLLADLVQDGHLDATVAPLFPCLKTLVLRHINLSPSSVWRDEERQLTNDFLRARKEAGLPVSKVILRGMKMGADFSFDGVTDDDALRELKEYVDEVIDRRRDHAEGHTTIMEDEDIL